MANQTRTSTLEELRHAIQEKERELSELDLMLADYHSIRSRLIRELRRLWVQHREAEEAVSAIARQLPD